MNRTCVSARSTSPSSRGSCGADPPPGALSGECAEINAGYLTADCVERARSCPAEDLPREVRAARTHDHSRRRHFDRERVHLVVERGGREAERVLMVQLVRDA